MLREGDKSADFTLKNQDDETVSLKDYEGKYLLLYFYPRDNTPGCTTEAINFSAISEELRSMNVEVVGVSKDSVKSHANFTKKKELTITLLSDPDRELIEAFGVWKLKKMYGKESMGIVRSTFLIDPEGTIIKAWPKVKVKVHADEVLEFVKSL